MELLTAEQKEKQLNRCYDESYDAYTAYVKGNLLAILGIEDWVMEEILIMDNTYKLADSGNRVEFETGAMREPKPGKGRFDLISPVALRRLAVVLEKGAEKYNDRNWEKGIKLSSFLDSAKRHLNQFEEICLAYRNNLDVSYLTDQGIDPNEDHLGQAFWNLHCLIHTEALMPEMDDLTQNENPELTTEILNAVHELGELASNRILENKVNSDVAVNEPLIERALRSWKKT